MACATGAPAVEARRAGDGIARARAGQETGRTKASDPALIAATGATALAPLALLLPPDTTWLQTWHDLLDLLCSVWLALFLALLVAQWLRLAVRQRPASAVTALRPDPDRLPAATSRKAGAAWAGMLLAICLLELLAHSGSRNPFLATSRPASGIERWTNADGYATLLDGVLAQGDGLFLLPMLKLFLGEAPPSPSDFDRRAGHVYLVSLLQRPLGTYWAFAAVNLLAWWLAALAIWWLGRQRWPNSRVPWIASLLAATGQGFIFMAGAPQAHVPAFAAFALVLALCDRLHLWEPGSRLSDWMRAGWAIGVAGLIYLVHLPCLLFLWLYGARRAQWLGLLAASVTALAIILGWQLYASVLLGLRFAGGNNDLSAEALAGWWRFARAGPVAVIDQLHQGSLRGLFVAAFYYPWWLLALLGFVGSSRESREWALAVVVAGALPAMAFTTRFQLPRLAYFLYPAVYLLAARGIEVLASAAQRLTASPVIPARPPPAIPAVPAVPVRPATRPAAPTLIVLALLVALLVALANADLSGVQQLNLWFHYSQGNLW
jgi:hypothetical protein